MKAIGCHFAVVTLFLVTASLAAADSSAEEPGNPLAADIEELKKGQEDIKKELEEIRKLLTRPPAQAVAEKLQQNVSLGSIVSRGKSDARVTMIEFSDYQCPYCKRHFEQTIPTLMRDYVEAGKLRYAFRDFPLVQIHPQAVKAAEAARCAGDQGKYWEMHDRLFASQSELQEDLLPTHAQALDLDLTQFGECLAQGRHADAVQKDFEAGTELGISGTPSFVLGVTDGDRVIDPVIIRGAHPLATFRAEIDKLLEMSPATD